MPNLLFYLPLSRACRATLENRVYMAHSRAARQWLACQENGCHPSSEWAEATSRLACGFFLQVLLQVFLAPAAC
jgi:hypothetical protein